jgi:exopolyphosphatase/guanosine-5'-triphosphate,3'-diphosphate pyrophosphatase
LRVAAVDLGTNSTRLLVADVAGGRVDEVVRRLTITRLGEGVDADGRLRSSAIGRVTACLAAYAREADDLGAERRLAIATSAIRDAANGADFLREVDSRHGFATRLLSGEEEADLMFRGVSSDRSVDDGVLLVDIGGGSTELVLGGPGGVAAAESLQIGCVRLTERFLHGDPPSRDELAACARYARSVLPALRPSSAIGVAGTVTTLAALDLGLAAYDPARIHRHRISRTAVREQLDRLAGMTLADRERIPGVEPGRAAVIVAGAVILAEVLAAFALEEIEASERDILHGAALAAAGS